jgi:hypothetical protein
VMIPAGFPMHLERRTFRGACLSSSVRELNHLFGDRPHADVTKKKPFEERLHSP